MAKVKIIGKVAVKVYPDTDDFKNDLKRDLKRIKRQVGNLEVEVVPNVNKAAEKKVKAQMERLRKNLSGKKVNVQPAVSKPGAAAVTAALAVLTKDRKVSIEPNLNQAAAAKALSGLIALGGGRVALDALHEGIEQLMELDRLVPKIGNVSVASTVLTAEALALTGNILSLGQSIASITGSLLALPGLFGGLAVGLGVSVAALKDFNDVIPELGQNLSRLQNQLSSRFWEGAEEPIRNMIDNLWPAFAQGVRQTADALGQFFGALANSMSGMDLAPMFDNLIESIAIFGQHTDSIATLIEKLGLVGSEYLPRLAAWFGDLLDKFAAIPESTLAQWAEQGITNLVALGNVLRHTYGIFSALGDAATAAGGATLTSLAAALERIRGTVESDGFQRGLTATFDAAFESVRRFNEAAGPGIEAGLLAIRDLFISVGPEISAKAGELMGAIGEALSNPAVMSGALSMFDGLKVAMDNLIAAAGPTAEIMAALGPVVGALAVNITALLTTGLDRMAPTFTKISEAIVPLINVLGGTMQDVMNSLTPLWQVMGQNIANVITALTPLIAAFRELWNLLAPVLIPVLKFVAKLIGDTVVLAIDGVTDVIQGLVKIIKGVVNFVKAIIKGDWKQAWESARDIFKGVFQAIVGIIKTLFAVTALKLIRGAWVAIKGLFKSFGGNLKTIASELWSSIKNNAKTAWHQIEVVPRLAWEAIKQFTRRSAGDLKAAASLVWEGVKTAIKNKIDLALKIVKAMPGNIKGAFGDAGSMLKGIGKAIIQGLLDGINALIGQVTGKLKWLTDKIPDWKGPAEKDKNLLKPAGQMIIESLLAGLESRFGDVRKSLGGLTSDIVKSFDGNDYRVGVATHFDTSKADLAPIDGLARTVALNATAGNVAAENGNVRIDNITIPLEDLKQLKSLEDFLEMLRVRTRQGVLA